MQRKILISFEFTLSRSCFSNCRDSCWSRCGSTVKVTGQWLRRRTRSCRLVSESSSPPRSCELLWVKYSPLRSISVIWCVKYLCVKLRVIVSRSKRDSLILRQPWQSGSEISQSIWKMETNGSARPLNLAHHQDPSPRFLVRASKRIRAKTEGWEVCWWGGIGRIRPPNWDATARVLVGPSGIVSPVEKGARTRRSIPERWMRTVRWGPPVWRKRTSAGWSRWTNRTRPPNSAGSVNRNIPKMKKEDRILKQR